MTNEEKCAWAVYSIIILFMLMMGTAALIKEIHAHELHMKMANCIGGVI